MAAPWMMMSWRSTCSPSRPSASRVRIRWPVLETGRNSVMPSTIPRMIASMNDMNGSANESRSLLERRGACGGAACPVGVVPPGQPHEPAGAGAARLAGGVEQQLLVRHERPEQPRAGIWAVVIPAGAVADHGAEHAQVIA